MQKKNYYLPISWYTFWKWLHHHEFGLEIKSRREEYSLLKCLLVSLFFLATVQEVTWWFFLNIILVLLVLCTFNFHSLSLVLSCLMPWNVPFSAFQSSLSVAFFTIKYPSKNWKILAISFLSLGELKSCFLQYIPLLMRKISCAFTWAHIWAVIINNLFS